MNSYFRIAHKMPHKFCSMVLFTGFMIILHVFDTSARYLPNGAKTQSVRITIFGIPDPDDAYPLKTPRQQLISTTFQAPANINTISNAPISSSALPLEVTTNAFTKAVLALPILQNILEVKIDNDEAGVIIYNIENAYLTALGHPSPATIASNDAQTIAGLNFLTLPFYIHLKGNTVEKFLKFLGMKVVPFHIQSFANSIENSLKSSVLDSNKALIRAIHEGYINFIQLLGLSFIEKAYTLSLIFHEEVIDPDKCYPLKTPNQQLISTTFTAPANTTTISNAPVSCSVPEFTPNAFTKAVLELPVLQNFLDIKIDRFEAGDLMYHVERVFLSSLGHPYPLTVSNIDGKITAVLNVLTIPFFIHLRGNTVEKFLKFQGIEVVPSHIQSFANSIENSFKYSVIDSNEALIRAIQEGYINFIQSLGLSFVEKAYILSLIFQEEVNANIN